MKVEIRKYERLLIIFLGLMTVIGYILQRLNLSPVYTAGFHLYNVTPPNHPFNFAANLLLPRIGVVILHMAVYFWINLFTIPQLRRTNYRSFYVYPWVLFQLLLLSYLLAIGVNVATYYAKPAWNSYGEFSLFASFGYNETPLTNLWTGFDRALIFMFVYATYFGIREFVIYRIENSGPKSNYRILITNQIGIYLFDFLLLPYLASAFHVIMDDGVYSVYFLFVPSVIFVYFSNTYWLFPSYANTPEISFKLLWRLAISTFFYSILFIVFINRTGLSTRVLLLNWIVQMVVITPVTWIVYQHRKDKIRELRGAEISLSKSTADLQFLRSQIKIGA